MNATITWNEKVQFSAVADSGHRVEIDGPAEFGGENKGIRPMELVLLGVAGCTSFDVVNILAKSRQAISNCVTKVTATRADTDPKVFTDIHFQFEVSGSNLDPKKVARAINLSAEKYCSASIMLQKGGVNITHGFDIMTD